MINPWCALRPWAPELNACGVSRSILALDPRLSTHFVAPSTFLINRDDCSKNLLEWSTHVAKNNCRSPRVV